MKSAKSAKSIKQAAHRSWLLLLLILVGYTTLQVTHDPLWLTTYNEGVNLQISQLIEQGYQPYTQIFTLAHPLFLWLIGQLGQLGLSPAGFKLFFLLFGLLLLVAIFMIARILLGDRVALAAVFLLVTTPAFVADTAPNIVAVTPAMSIATLSLAITLWCLSLKRQRWLVVGGILWGISIFLSSAMLNVGLVALIFIIFFEAGVSNKLRLAVNWPRTVKFSGLWLIPALIALGLGLILTTPEIIFGYLFRDYVTVYQNRPPSLENTFALIGQFTTYNLWLSFLAIYGLASIYKKADHPLWVILIWCLLSFCWLILQATSQLEDTAILLPPLAVLGGWGLVELVSHLLNWTSSWQVANTKQPLFRLGLGCLLGAIYFLGVWQQVNKFNLRDIQTESELQQLEQRQEIVTFIQQHTTPQDCVIIDDAALAVAANRLPPPQLIELSSLRLSSGLINEEAIISATQEHQCKAAVFSKRKYSRPLANFEAWARSYYPNQWDFIRTTIYYQ